MNPLTHHHRRRHFATAAALLVLIVSPACATADDDDDGSPVAAGRVGPCAEAAAALQAVDQGATLFDPALVDAIGRFRTATITAFQEGRPDGTALISHSENLGNLLISASEGLDVQAAVAAELVNAVTECQTL